MSEENKMSIKEDKFKCPTLPMHCLQITQYYLSHMMHHSQKPYHLRYEDFQGHKE